MNINCIENIMSSSEKRISYLDMMKGMAILLVVIGHLIQFSFGYEISHSVRFLYFHMPVFFYISGFLAYKKILSFRDLGKKLIKRGITLFLPYVVFLTCWCVFSGYTDIIGIILGGGGGYWFLYTLFIISMFFLIYEYIIRHIEKTWIYVMLWIIPYVIIIIVKMYLNRIDSGGGLYDIVAGIVNYYRYYLIGYMCKKYINFNKLIFCNDIVAGLGLIAYFLNWYFFERHNILLIFGGSMGAIIVLQRFFQMAVKEDSGIGKALSSIGKQSLAIYVIHYFLIPDVSASMHDFLDCPNSFIWQLTFAFLLSIPIIAISMLVGRLISTNKLLNFVCFGKLFWNEKK